MSHQFVKSSWKRVLIGAFCLFLCWNYCWSMGPSPFWIKHAVYRIWWHQCNLVQKMFTQIGKCDVFLKNMWIVNLTKNYCKCDESSSTIYHQIHKIKLLIPRSTPLSCSLSSKFIILRKSSKRPLGFGSPLIDSPSPWQKMCPPS